MKVLKTFFKWSAITIAISICWAIVLLAFTDTKQPISTDTNVVPTMTPAVTAQPTITILATSTPTMEPTPFITPTPTKNVTAEPTECPTENPEVLVWITNNGSRYHSNKECSNMKTPSLVPISEVGSRTPCSKCY